MAFKQIISRRHQDRPEPYVRIGRFGCILNPAAVELVGPKTTRCVVFYDKEENRLAFTFFTGGLTGSYAFGRVPNSEARRVAVGPFLEKTRVLKKLTKKEYPILLLDEVLPEYAQAKVFVVNLY